LEAWNKDEGGLSRRVIAGQKPACIAGRGAGPRLSPVHEAERLARRRAAQALARRRRGYALAGLVAIAALAAGVALAWPSGHAHRAAPPPAAPPPAAAVARHTVRHHTAETAARRLRNHGSPIPILMYHVLEAPAAGAPYPELYVR